MDGSSSPSSKLKSPPKFPAYCFSGLLPSLQDNVNTRPPTLAKIQVVPLNPGSAVLPPLAGFVWPKKASLMVLLKGDGVGTLKGLFLAACHCETFQLATRTKTTAREPRLLRFCPGSTSGTAQHVGVGPGRLCSPLMCS